MKLTLGQALMKLVESHKAGKAQEPDHYTAIPYIHDPKPRVNPKKNSLPGAVQKLYAKYLYVLFL